MAFFNMLDIRTLFLAATVINLLLTFFILSIWIVHRRRFRGILFWALGNLSFALGSGLIGLRGFLPDVLSVVIANTSIILSIALIYSGIIRFKERPVRIVKYVPYAAALATFVIFLYFTYVINDLKVRIIVVSLAGIVNLGICVWELLKGDMRTPPPVLIIAGSMISLMIFMAIRIAFIHAMPDVSDLMRSGAVTIIITFLLIVSITGWSVGFLLMISWELQEQERQLTADREVLIREVHHRVKNNLAIVQGLLSLQLESDLQKGAREVLSISRDRIQSISMVHEMLYSGDTISEIMLDEYLSLLANRIISTIQPSGVKLKEHLQPVSIDMIRVVPCGLFVNELISNSCKYAFPGEREGVIKLTLDVHEGEVNGRSIFLEVADNGIGLPGEYSPGAGETLGLKIVSAMAKQLRGKLDIRKDSGTAIGVTFTA